MDAPNMCRLYAALLVFSAAITVLTALAPLSEASTYMNPLPKWTNGHGLSWKENRSFSVSWDGDYNVSVKCYNIAWSSSNLSQPPNISSWQLLKYNGSECFPAYVKQAFFGNGSPHISEGVKYYFASRAESIQGQREPWPGVESIENSTRFSFTSVDATPPVITALARDQNGNILPTGVIPEYIGSVSIVSEASDGISGIDNASLSAFLFPGGATETDSCTRNGTSVICTQYIQLSRNTQAGFSSAASDKAGNTARFPREGGWSFAATHPLTNFAEDSISINLGSSSESAIAVRNIRNETDNVTVTLSGYRLAGFLSSPGSAGSAEISGKSMKIYSLRPGEQRVFGVRILSGEPGYYTLNATAQDTKGVSDSTGLGIIVLFPASFSATGIFSDMLMLLAAAAVFGLRGKRKER